MTALTTPKPMAKPDLSTLPRWARWYGDQRLHLYIWTGFPCCGCGVNIIQAYEYFMVTNRVWADAGWCPQALSCIGCTEERLGRELNASDFTAVPINFADTFHGRTIWRSARFKDRVGRIPAGFDLSTLPRDRFDC